MKKKLLRILVIAAMLVIMLLPCTPVLADDWYVDSDVGASGNGTSVAEAFKTINEGFVAANGTPYDYIHVGGGTYAEYPWTGSTINGTIYLAPASVNTSLSINSVGYDLNLNKQGTGNATVGLAMYSTSPQTDLSSDYAVYCDLHVSTTTNITSVGFTLTAPEAVLNRAETWTLNYWNGSAWAEFSSYTYVGTVFTANVTSSTSPTLAQLTGVPVGLGGNRGTAATLLFLIPTIFGIVAVVSLFLLIPTKFSVPVLVTAIVSGILAAVSISVLVNIVESLW